jgi:L-alanine-DL-glutamate epimerase-like enolase superfamily enzyme
VVRIRKLSFSELNVPLHEPFGIATGAQPTAENVLVRLELDDGTVGLGEAAPVPHISGETRSAVLSGLERLREECLGLDVQAFRRVCGVASEILQEVPSALAGFEIALFDAIARRQRLSLVDWFGGDCSELTLDLTITTGSVEQASHAAVRAAQDGFELLKVKVGGSDLDLDVRRLRAILRAAPKAQLVLDGNTAFDVKGALALLDGLGKERERIVLFEQPVARDDFEGLRQVEQESGVTVAADESLRGFEDFRAVLRTGGIGAINVKTAKLGLLRAWELLVAARTAGLNVMVGGMVETEISMTASACLAAGVGGVQFCDLDTPRFLASSPALGKVAPWGPKLDLSPIARGHGVLLTEGCCPPGGAAEEASATQGGDG